MFKPRSTVSSNGLRPFLYFFFSPFYPFFYTLPHSYCYWGPRGGVTRPAVPPLSYCRFLKSAIRNISSLIAHMKGENTENEGRRERHATIHFGTRGGWVAVPTPPHARVSGTIYARRRFSSRLPRDGRALAGGRGECLHPLFYSATKTKWEAAVVASGPRRAAGDWPR
jgi:hypothetical protein